MTNEGSLKKVEALSIGEDLSFLPSQPSEILFVCPESLTISLEALYERAESVSVDQTIFCTTSPRFASGHPSGSGFSAFRQSGVLDL